MTKLMIKFKTNTSNNIQECNCINEIGLSLLIKNMHIRRFNTEQIQSLNKLRKYLNLDILDDDIYVTFTKDKISKVVKKYNIYIQDCIKEVLKINPNIKWYKCSKCGNYYPYHSNFFEPERKSKYQELQTVCRSCKKWTDSRQKGHIKHSDNILYKAFRDYGLEVYEIYKNKDVIKIYQHWKENNISKFIPEIIKNKDSYLKIIKYYYNLGYITKDNLCENLLTDNYKLTGIGESGIVSTYDIYVDLFGADYKYYPWKYPKLRQSKLTYEEGKIIFNNYLKENNIVIDDIFTFKYSDILKKAKLTQFEKDILGFIVKYYDFKYAGYQFKTRGVNYYKDKGNRIFDLKYFIEQDMKIPIDKIPLYLTKMTLQRNARSLYTLLYDGKYYKNLYEWVNEIYTNKFIESDFVINPYRDEFDSTDESQIDDILHSKFNTNVIYNQRNTDRTININGMIPDWIVFTDKGCYLIEYFGLYVENRSNNKRIGDYIKRTDNKIEKYSEIKGYEFIELLPSDLNNDFKGVRDKIDMIK